MKIFLSSMEDKKRTEYILRNIKKMNYNLMSFFYLRKDLENAKKVRDNSKEVLIDSGAHSFQKGTKVDWNLYTEEYANFIKNFDRPNVIGYFEMDVDNIIGYDKVLELRQELEKVSNKIIPVWHKNRGIEEYKKMCKDYKGRVIAITGFKNEDIKDEQYLMFLKYAKKYDCRVHCLGMTRRKVLDKVPFDYADSSTWLQQVRFGNTLISKKKFAKAKGEEQLKQYLFNYKEGMQMQQLYYEKWKKVCKD